MTMPEGVPNDAAVPTPSTDAEFALPLNVKVEPPDGPVLRMRKLPASATTNRPPNVSYARPMPEPLYSALLPTPLSSHPAAPVGEPENRVTVQPAAGLVTEAVGVGVTVVVDDEVGVVVRVVPLDGEGVAVTDALTTLRHVMVRIALLPESDAPRKGRVRGEVCEKGRGDGDVRRGRDDPSSADPSLHSPATYAT